MDLVATRAQTLGKARDLRRLPRPLAAFQCDEAPGSAVGHDSQPNR